MNGTLLVVEAVRRFGRTPLRVEWLGQVFSGNSPKASVVFSRWGADPETGEMHASATHLTAAVPVAYLRMFRVGDIWQDGINTGQRDTQTRETLALNIKEGSVQVLPVGMPLAGGGASAVYPLPFSLFAGHRENTQAHCVRIVLNDGAILVIPCMELVRFYFGASGAFLKRLFSGAFAMDALYSRAHLNSETGAANVDLADDLSGVAAVTVARIAFDNQARNAARWIVNSATAASVRRDRYHPKTTFPFYGDTQLTVDGRWIDQGCSRVFLAEQLIQCTHAFPFRSLYYTTRKSATGSARDIRGAPKTDSGNPPSHGDEVRTELCLSADGTSPTLRAASIRLNEDVFPFPDLQAKKIRRVRKDAQAFSLPPAAEFDTALSAGSPTPGAVDRAVDVDGFDESMLEELPPEQLGVLSEAFSAYEAASRNMPPSRSTPVVWTAPDGSSGENVRERFVRGDRCCKADEPRLINVWCSLLGVPENPFRLLVLVRANVAEDVLDHVVFLRFNAIRNHGVLAEAILAFARFDLRSLSQLEVVEAIETESIGKLSSVLRTMSRAIQQMLHGARHQSSRLAAPWPIA